MVNQVDYLFLFKSFCDVVMMQQLSDDKSPESQLKNHCKKVRGNEK